VERRHRGFLIDGILSAGGIEDREAGTPFRISDECWAKLRIIGQIQFVGDVE
jgi:hypothetical protein